MLLNKKWITEEIKEVQKCLETNKKENPKIQNLWYSAKAVLRGKFIAIQARKIPNKQPNLTPKGTRKEE